MRASAQPARKPPVEAHLQGVVNRLSSVGATADHKFSWVHAVSCRCRARHRGQRAYFYWIPVQALEQIVAHGAHVSDAQHVVLADATLDLQRELVNTGRVEV